jgi:hypothetical protein
MQVGATYGSHAPSAPESGLDIKRAPPVLIVSGKPFVAGAAVDVQLVIPRCSGWPIPVQTR